jgi:hypothetical protein
VEIASFDNYGASYVWSNIKKQTGIVVATSGLKTLKAKIVGRNASATNWYMYFQTISIWRTA